MDDFSRDPARNAELGALLRGLDEPPVGEVDWERMRASISARAELPLARLRRQARPWPRLRALVPLAAAASLAAGALALTLRPDREQLPDAERRLVDQIVEASVPENVGRLISGEADRDALLEAVVGS